MKRDVLAYSSTFSMCEQDQQWITATTLLCEMRPQHRQGECERGQRWITAMTWYHQCMREGSAEDHSNSLAVADAAALPWAIWLQHMQRDVLTDCATIRPCELRQP